MDVNLGFGCVMELTGRSSLLFRLLLLRGNGNSTHKQSVHNTQCIIDYCISYAINTVVFLFGREWRRKQKMISTAKQLATYTTKGL